MCFAVDSHSLWEGGTVIHEDILWVSHPLKAKS